MRYSGGMKDARFEWDEKKDKENRAKHGVSFAVGQLAFLDPRRVIAEDTGHSAREKRFFCVGRVGGGHPDGAIHGAWGCDPHLRRRLLAKGEADL
jgi:Ribonuclease toxin, BrnT, of type II toxin-antitoxin system